MTVHRGATATSIDERGVTLKKVNNLQADLVVGIGVQPPISLAKRAGPRLDRSVGVDEYESSRFVTGEVHLSWKLAKFYTRTIPSGPILARRTIVSS
jgi:NAD(P)H-nitrite reductase large subunit